MKYVVVAVAAVALAGCATMSEEQCLAGDWYGQGFTDGAAGYSYGRLNEHTEACARHGVYPDVSAYAAGRDQGLLQYCTPANGFRVGRAGTSYSGVCPGGLEADFMYGYNDGRVLWTADQQVAAAVNAINEARNRANNLEQQIRAEEDSLSDEALTQAQRDTIRARIRRLRDDRERAFDDMRRAERDADYARREVADLERRLMRGY